MNNLTKAYVYSRCELELMDGTKLPGKATDMFEFTNDDGEEQGYDVIMFKADSFEHGITLREEQIKNVVEIE